jgi:hypothetical protein
VSFQENRGAPAHVAFPKLSAWNENSDKGVKYFSGTGTYSKTIEVSPEWFTKRARLWLDLGEVRNLAEVSVNGKSLGTVWKKPYRVDVSSSLKPGENVVKISVVNAWVNRMIGDRQPDVVKKYTFTNPEFYKSDSPLLPSGLLRSSSDCEGGEGGLIALCRMVGELCNRPGTHCRSPNMTNES